MYVLIHDILVFFVSSRRSSDVGSTVNNCSCTLLTIRNQRCKVLTLCMLVSYAENIASG